MSERQDTLQQYVSDMLALERHIHEALERQSSSGSVRDHPEASQLISRAEGILKGHITALEQHLSSIGGDAGSPVKESVAAALGVAAGLIDRVRTQQVSKDLRDDYTAFSAAAISYTMLHTTGLALESRTTADLAVRHLKELTPVLVEISEVIPNVVVRELTDDSEMIDTTVAGEATRNTQEAWDGDHVHAEHMHTY
ncbi:MAG: hypothetical protein ACRDIB_08040 [Ardenticatenaceae bacterium]